MQFCASTSIAIKPTEFILTYFKQEGFPEGITSTFNLTILRKALIIPKYYLLLNTYMLKFVRCMFILERNVVLLECQLSYQGSRFSSSYMVAYLM